MPHRPATPRLLLALLAIAAGSVAFACTPSRPRMGEVPGYPRDSLRSSPRRTSASAREVVEKRVVAKRPTSLLVAADESWCAVSDEEFAATKIGDRVRCAWVPATAR
jgi:hypothetical protein